PRPDRRHGRSPQSHSADRREDHPMSIDDSEPALPEGRRPQVLFVCVHNAGRSQMAAALLDHHADGRVEVRSAGSTPADEINPTVRTAMAEIGIDLDGPPPTLARPSSDATTHPTAPPPNPPPPDALKASDVVITMGCGDPCPVFPGKR